MAAATKHRFSASEMASSASTRRGLIRQTRSGKRSRRGDIRGGHRVLGEAFGDTVALVRIETVVGIAGEVEEVLGLVLGHINREAAPPQRVVGRRGPRIAVGSV